MSNKLERVRKIEGRISVDLNKRGTLPLSEYVKEDLLKATFSILNTLDPRVLILTGFYIPEAEACETDGITGSVMLADYFYNNAIPVTLITDSKCEKVLSQGVRSLRLGSQIQVISVDIKSDYKEELKNLKKLFYKNYTHFISVERPGKNSKGKYYDMLGDDISKTLFPFDQFYSDFKGVKIAIGDGGNEIGMGKIPSDIISKNVKEGKKIACVTPCDNLIVSDISDWGCYALISSLSLIKPGKFVKNILSKKDITKILEDIVIKAGAVDGVTKNKTVSVDGLNLDKYLKIIDEIENI